MTWPFALTIVAYFVFCGFALWCFGRPAVIEVKEVKEKEEEKLPAGQVWLDKSRGIVFENEEGEFYAGELVEIAERHEMTRPTVMWMGGYRVRYRESGPGGKVVLDCPGGLAVKRMSWEVRRVRCCFGPGDGWRCQRHMGHKGPCALVGPPG